MAAAEVRWSVVVNDLPKIRQGMESTAARIVAKTALDLEGHMKRRVPVDTGNLRSSIRAVKVAAQHWRVTVGAEYGLFVEYGTAHMAAQPYYNPAIRVVIPEFRKAWEAILSA